MQKDCLGSLGSRDRTLAEGRRPISTAHDSSSATEVCKQSWLDLNLALLNGDSGKVTGARDVMMLERKQLSQ